jgi:hypothetical protein
MLCLRLLSGFPLLLLPLLLGGCSLSKPTLHAKSVGLVARPNRLIESGTMWEGTRPLLVTLRNAQIPGHTLRVELRAIHDGKSLGLLAFWPDDTPIDPYERSWVLAPGNEHYALYELPPDTFAIKFRLEGAETACMMTGEEGVYDLWQWRAGWSNISGYADNSRMFITRTPPESGKFSTYLSPVGGPPIYIQIVPDEGRPPYELAGRPQEKRYRVVPGLAPQNPTGSQADVLAEGLHQGGVYFVEFKRDLITGHDDDFQFEGRGPFSFSIAITNDGGGQSHFTSDLLRLRLE